MMQQQVNSLALQLPLLLMLLLLSFWHNDNNMAMAKTLQQNAGKNLVLVHVKDGISAQRNYASDYDDDELKPRRHQSVDRKRKQAKQRRRLKYENHKQNQQIKPRNPEEDTIITTESPLIHYWNSFVRSVTVPMSNLRLNITNSLANFFNDGSANIMETPPLVINDEYQPSESFTYMDNTSSRKRKRSHKKKRKPTINRYSSSSSPSRFGDQYATAGSYYYDQTTPYYYFDRKTGNYYGLQPMASNNDYYNRLQLYNYYYPSVNGQVTHVYDNYYGEKVVVMNKPVKKHKSRKPPKLPEDKPLSNAHEDQEIQNDAINNDDDDDTNVDELNNVVYDDDENIAVVEKLEDDEDDDENENYEQPAQSQQYVNDSNQEQLRNELGSFMRDDRFSRLRQRTPGTQDQRSNKNKPLDKQGPRQQKYKYYYLNL